MKKLVRKKRLITSQNPIHSMVSVRASCCQACHWNQFCAVTPWWMHQGAGDEDAIACQCINKYLPGGGDRSGGR